MVDAAPLKRTPLHDAHRALGARFVPFAGWEMPVFYSGVIEEHHAVRSAAGLFDVSHMGEIEVRGPGAEDFLQRMTPNDVASLFPGQAHYTALLTEQGTFVDDLIAWRCDADRFLLVVNAANTATDLAWLKERVPRHAEVSDLSDRTALLALQGPRAAAVLETALGMEISSLRSFHLLATVRLGVPLMISRTGYTGEDGFEIALPPERAADLWALLLDRGREAGVRPVGLGARDTLRLEAALRLYGQDIDRTTTVWEAGLGFIVRMAKGDFIGRDALARQKAEGARRRLAGFRLEARGVPRHGYVVRSPERACGEVTSGGFSPTLGAGIGLAYLPADSCTPGLPLAVLIRDAEVPARIVDIPFYRRPAVAPAI